MVGADYALLEQVRAGLLQRATVGWRCPVQADSQALVGQSGEAALEIDSPMAACLSRRCHDRWDGAAPAAVGP